jgi:hypothetical protein
MSLVTVSVKARRWPEEFARLAEQRLIRVHGLPPHRRERAVRTAALRMPVVRTQRSRLPGLRRGVSECDWNLCQSTLLHFAISRCSSLQMAKMLPAPQK